MKTQIRITKEQAKLITAYVDTDEKRAIAIKNECGLENVNALIRGDRFNAKILADLLKRAENNKAKQAA